MGEELYRRLKQLKKAREASPRESRVEAPREANAARGPLGSPPAQPNHAEGLERGTRVHARDEGWNQIAAMVWERTIAWPNIELPRGAFFSHLLHGEVASTDLRFMDTETTGLSGGAGTTVFLSGCARIEDGVLTFRQTLLSDFPGEHTFVEHCVEHLGRETVWVSYNGKSFDARQLQTRCLMNGIRPAYPVHIDLLYWARRLWSRMLPNCSLTSIETHILGEPRVDDLPSIEVPERYFSFLESNDWSLLEPVFEHHLRDVRSLVDLFLLFEDVLGGLTSDGSAERVNAPTSIADMRGHAGGSVRHAEQARGGATIFDAYQLGRWLLSKSSPGGVALLEEVLTRGGLDDADRERAAFYLLRFYRRSRQSSECARIAEACTTPSQLVLVEELAKFYEHDRRDPARALDLLLTFRRYVPIVHRQGEIERRIARLERKLIALGRGR